MKQSREDMSILQEIKIRDKGNEEVSLRHGKEIEFGLLSFSFPEKKSINQVKTSMGSCRNRTHGVEHRESWRKTRQRSSITQ